MSPALAAGIFTTSVTSEAQEGMQKNAAAVWSIIAIELP